MGCVRVSLSIISALNPFEGRGCVCHPACRARVAAEISLLSLPTNQQRLFLPEEAIRFFLFDLCCRFGATSARVMFLPVQLKALLRRGDERRASRAVGKAALLDCLLLSCVVLGIVMAVVLILNSVMKS